MEKNVMLAVIISIVVLIVWPHLMPKQDIEKKTLTTKLQEDTVQKDLQIKTETKTIAANSTEPEAKIALKDVQYYTLENKHFKLRFSSLGARLNQIFFKKYKINFFTDKQDNNGPAFLFKPIDKLLFKLESRTAKNLVFVSNDGDKVVYTISNTRIIRVNVYTKRELKVSMIYKSTGGEGRFGLTQDPLKRERHFMYYFDNNLETLTNDEIKEAKTYSISPRWLALSDRYFTMAIMPESKGLFSAISFKNENDRYEMQANVEPFNELSYKMYLGEKDVDYLRNFDKTLDTVVDYGIYSAIAVPILEFMKFIHRYVPNYGWAIVLLTVLIRLLLFPLQHNSMKSMKRLQVLQPHMARLKEKYKDDKETLNREMMKLMATHKVNPAKGCLPMLLQLPILFALYRVLGNAVELYKEPWVLWITDLSVKDPLYILPALMGIAMFIQQKLSPSNLDPAQAKMMLIMPIFMAFIMASLPSGLTLYILASTLFGLAQQLIINKQLNT